MEIKLGGDFTVKKTPDEVYNFLADPNRFCPLLPDFQSMEIVDSKNFLVKLSVGISHIRGIAAVKMTLVDEQRPKQAVYEGKGEVPGGSATIRAQFQLEELPGGQTKVIWSGQSSVLGRVISLAGGLLEPLGKKNVQKLIDGLQKALG
ncbi:MAG TPA: SRPBCC domain-containing protein [Candidatus Acidoferrum sp.]|jgi:carbon monoxide dehydrogenase subunit G|nr:SRPBCC domain-containing protein [Candidatus Acidoferrum sp.]